MSYYYKYNFISPEGVFAIVREEFKSYFDTGAIDDIMFYNYVDKCLKKLGRSSYTITEDYLEIEDFESHLPDNFYSVREAWLCTSVKSTPHQSSNSFYSQAASETTIQISPITSGGRGCTNLDCNDEDCNGECMPEFVQAVYKTNNTFRENYSHSYLLKPGNISVHKNCSMDCVNKGSSSADSFDIRDNKFVTNFRKGIVHLIFYAYDYDENGGQLIPDNYRIKEFIEAFLKYKVVETLLNQVNDETYKQLEAKLMRYEKLYDESYIMANIEIKKQTEYEKQRRIKNDLNRHNIYELPGRINQEGWRRNN